MEYSDFRQKIIELERYEGCVKIDRCPLINPGFPGSFNMSFGEDAILKEYGRYQFFDHNYIFSTIQQVIRHNDLFDGVKTNPEKYLGIFEMADIYGLIMLKEKINLEELQIKQVEKTINLLTEIGIKKEDIFPKYCGGGSVRKLTNGKYAFDKIIPEDIVTLNALVSMGIPKENICKDYTRDTLLALHMASGNIAWGYRVEVEVKTKMGLLDIATIELFLWDPVLNDKKEIVDIQDITYTLALTVTGVERLYVVASNLVDVRDIPHIKNLYDLVSSKNIGVEYLRALHAIISDQIKFNFELGKHRKVYMNRMAREINLSERNVLEILNKNAEYQIWHPELRDGIKTTFEYISDYKKQTNTKIVGRN